MGSANKYEIFDKYEQSALHELENQENIPSSPSSSWVTITLTYVMIFSLQYSVRITQANLRVSKECILYFLKYPSFLTIENFADSTTTSLHNAPEK